MLRLITLTVVAALAEAKGSLVQPSQLPLSVNGSFFVDTNSGRVKLSCLNWYGTDQKDYVVGGLQWAGIDEISALIAGWGFNCVRLPWSLEVVDKNPILSNATKVAREPTLYNQPAMVAMDRVVASLAAHRVMVILDNHISDANWCCSGSDGNGLWYTDNYPAQKWLDTWHQVATRYASNPYVVGCDLRNELRATTVNGKNLKPTWGSGDAATDWRLAAISAIKVLQGVNPDLVMLVEGIDYALDLQGVAVHPILDADVNVPHKVAYSAHSYSWDYKDPSYGQLSQQLEKSWGYITEPGKPYTAPVWVGEFGQCHYATSSCLGGTWWQSVTKYFAAHTTDYGYWALDGTESTGDGRVYGAEETYGVLNMTWNGVASPLLLHDLQSLQH